LQVNDGTLKSGFCWTLRARRPQGVLPSSLGRRYVWTRFATKNNGCKKSPETKQRVETIEILGAMYARRSMFEKKEKFFNWSPPYFVK
jgi:hypothetical protein